MELTETKRNETNGNEETMSIQPEWIGPNQPSLDNACVCLCPVASVCLPVSEPGDSCLSSMASHRSLRPQSFLPTYHLAG
jgi:hypothetical protein